MNVGGRTRGGYGVIDVRREICGANCGAVDVFSGSRDEGRKIDGKARETAKPDGTEYKITVD